MDKTFHPYSILKGENRRRGVKVICGHVANRYYQLTDAQLQENDIVAAHREKVEKEFCYAKNRFTILQETFRHLFEWFNRIMKTCLGFQNIELFLLDDDLENESRSHLMFNVAMHNFYDEEDDVIAPGTIA